MGLGKGRKFLVNQEWFFYQPDNASAFKSTELRNYSVESNIGIMYSTPYVHTPIGLVEATTRTLEDNTKKTLVEENLPK